MKKQTKFINVISAKLFAHLKRNKKTYLKIGATLGYAIASSVLIDPTVAFADIDSRGKIVHDKIVSVGVPVDLYSNYGLQDSKELKSYKDFFGVAKSLNSIVVLDEAHVNLDSRLFGKGSNIYMTQFFSICVNYVAAYL